MQLHKITQENNQIDDKYAYQIALPQLPAIQSEISEVIGLADKLGRSRHGLRVSHDDIWYAVYCFPKKDNAEIFKVAFGGFWFNQRKQVNVKAKWKWNKPLENIAPD